MGGMAPPKKPPGSSSRPHRKGKAINVFLPDKLKAALDAYVDASRPKTTGKAVIEAALEDFLARSNFWPYPPPASTTPSTTKP